ncbi:hypothetical protein L1785_02860 [Antribacter sp. KLBMP9083]|uniref:Uncharacterized protein n=1 Tax=Antribacter soli TaxID=2910976 RepID=A0AA41U601_9MICO|nr:hypothetical protein [Antribacter soli]MCF4119911.1 hypothetical protein [Antribacter soli]
MDVSTPSPSETPHDPALHLRGVLDTALPPELGTTKAPDRYTVAAVFNRRVLPQEQALIEQPSVSRLLADRGYEGIQLAVADRRLLIENTNLAMLESGLAGEIAAVLRGVNEEITAERTRQAAEADEWRAGEARRAAAVKVEAERVRFE